MATVNSLFQGLETKRTDVRKRIACNSSPYKSQAHTKEQRKWRQRTDFKTREIKESLFRGDSLPDWFDLNDVCNL